MSNCLFESAFENILKECKCFPGELDATIKWFEGVSTLVWFRLLAERHGGEDKEVHSVLKSRRLGQITFLLLLAVL